MITGDKVLKRASAKKTGGRREKQGMDLLGLTRGTYVGTLENEESGQGTLGDDRELTGTHGRGLRTRERTSNR